MDGYGPQDVPTFATGTISVLSLLGNDTVGAEEGAAAGAFGASSAMARAVRAVPSVTALMGYR